MINALLKTRIIKKERVIKQTLMTLLYAKLKD